jgi:hypothetical protein
MGLIDKWEEDFFEDLDGLDMSNIGNYLKKNREAIIFLSEHKKDINKKIEEKLEEFVIEEALNLGYQRLLKGFDPNSIGHPEYFAYALALDRNKTIFTFDQLHKINLQNDRWKEKFIEKYSKKDLLKNLREKFLDIY